jgi:predicted nucleic acid-binding protein
MIDGKPFDCVEMKNAIQRKLRAEYAGLPDAERRERMNQKLMADPVFGSMLRQAEEAGNRVREEGPGCGRKPHALKVFVDTSVFGGCFDREFDKESRWFFDEVKAGRFDVLVSRIVLEELEYAPQHVRDFFNEQRPHIKILDESPEVKELRDAYISAGILGESSLDDAEHIAAASIEAVDLMVSWNFKHIVHFDKIRAYNAINVLRGWREIDIRCPREVIAYDE